jgi:hypothetical protein
VDALLIIVFLVLIGAGVAVFVRGRNRERAASGAGTSPQPLAAGQAPGGEQSDARRLKPGDVVNHGGRDYIVEGTVRLEQGGYRWDEHRLVDAGESIWLSVEDDEGLEIVVWDRRKGTGLEPGPQTVEVDGVSYELDERGKANFTSEGVTGMSAGGRLEYADYEAGDKRLSFERGEGEESWEVSVGERIGEAMIDIYPSRGS